ncbi:MAG: hypothetical protein J6W19_01380, partial [Prevotella sp.]|nr:hypothetical protein [Prevotella sp.]
ATIAYAELCDTYSLAAGTIFRLTDGAGTGIVELPADLHSGYYLLSVYTRNDTTLSQQLVAVVNPLHKSEDDDIEWVSINDNGEEKSYPAPPKDICNPPTLPSQLSTLNSQLSTFNSSLYSGSKFFTLHSSLFTIHSSLFPPQSPELEGHIIRARVRNVYEGRTFKGSDILPSLSIIGKQIHYFEGAMVSDTIAVFHTFGIQGTLPLVLSATSSTGVSLPIEMISPFATLLPKELPHLEFHYNRSEVEARSLAMQRRLQSKEDLRPSTTDLRPQKPYHQTTNTPDDYDDTLFGTRPYLTYNLDEYRQFRTIREVLLEYVSCVSTTRVNSQLQLIVRRELYNRSPSLVLIDGMPVLDTERLLNYDARRLHHINIYDGQYTFGHVVYNGVLSFVTRSGHLTNYPTERNMQYLEYTFP